MSEVLTSAADLSLAAARRCWPALAGAPLGDDAIQAAVLRLILYFDVFKHPLRDGELARLVAPDRPEAVEAAASALVAAGRIESRGPWRFAPGGAVHLDRRQRRARCAEQVWPEARAAAGALAALPFVRGVLITGGMSKLSTGPDADVDFLLLVEPGRVWTLKSLLQGARRVLPSRLRELFCTNYLLDTEHLTVDDRNLFTAIELATAIPMAGPEACVALLQANAWAAAYVPGLWWSAERASHAAPVGGGPARAVEAAWRGPVAARIESASLSAWQRFWDRKYQWLDARLRSQRFKRRPEIATNHLHDFQDYVLREVGARFAAAGLDESPGVRRGAGA